MPQALFLRAQVADVRGRGADLKGDPFRHANTVRAELLDFRGVVRHQLDRGDPEDPQRGCGTLVTPKIRGKTKSAVRVDRVEAVILQVVRRDLVDDADAPSLLGEVQEDALRRPADSLQCGVQLLAAVAPLRAEYIAGHAFGMQAHEDVLLPRDPSYHEGDVLFAAERADERGDAEVPVPGREPRLTSEQDVVAEFAFEAGHVPRFRQIRRI